MHDDLTDDFTAHLREQLKQFLFASGATLEHVAASKFTSTSLTRQEALERETAAGVARIEARDMVQQAALAATNRRLDSLGDVLAKLKSAAAGDEHMQWHDLLPSLSPAERGKLLENLWRITPDAQTAVAVVAVAGSECLWLAPASPDGITKRVTLNDDLGGLRSVTYDSQDARLLVGAARGVWLLDAATGDVCGRFEVPDVQPRTGFNSAIACGGRLYAAHSQLGCWSWPLDKPGDARCILSPVERVPRTVRAVTALPDGPRHLRRRSASCTCTIRGSDDSRHAV